MGWCGGALLARGARLHSARVEIPRIAPRRAVIVERGLLRIWRSVDWRSRIRAELIVHRLGLTATPTTAAAATTTAPATPTTAAFSLGSAIALSPAGMCRLIAR